MSQTKMTTASGANITSKNASGSELRVYSKTEGIVWCSAFILTTLLIVIGNLLTIVLFFANKSLRRKSLFLVVNMAFADLMLGTLSVPGYIFFIGGYNHKLWTARMSSSLDYAHDIVDTFFIYASIISAAMISGERFYAIASPYRYKRSLSMKKYCAVISMSWLLTILVTAFEITLRHFTSPEYEKYAWISFSLIITLTICGCNISIWRKFQSAELTFQAQNRAARNRRLTKTLLFVSVLALLSWLPLIIMDALEVVFGVTIPPGNFYYIVTLLNYSNSFLKPVVYGFRIPEFRQALAICCFTCKRKLSVNIKSTERRCRNNCSFNSETRLKTLEKSHSRGSSSLEVESTWDTSL